MKKWLNKWTLLALGIGVLSFVLRLGLTGAFAPKTEAPDFDVWLAYTLSAPEVSVQLPEDALVCTRDMEPDDPVFDRMELTYADCFLSEGWETCQLIAVHTEAGLLLRLQSYALNAPDFRQMEKEELLSAVGSALESAGAPYGADDFSVYTHPQATFLQLSTAPANEDGFYTELFLTVRDETCVTLIFESRFPFVRNTRKEIDAVMASLDFLAETTAAS